MKGNNGTNRILYHDISAQTIAEHPPCFTVGTEPGIPVCRLPLVFSKRKLFLMYGTALRMAHLTIPHTRFQLSSMIVALSFTHLSIAAQPWMLDF
jgi:hypothetical protein